MHSYNTKEKIMLVSYIDKKKSGKKNVIVLLSTHDNVKIMKDQRKKSNVHTMYYHMKGCVVIVNLLSTTHSTQIKFRRWPFNALGFILDTCCLNAKTILQDNGIRLTDFEMAYNLGMELVLPAIISRCSQSNGLNITVISKIRRVSGINKVFPQPQSENFNPKSGRCILQD